MRRPKHPERETDGRKALVAYLDDKSVPGRSQSALAELLDIGQSSVSLWYHGSSRPEPALREALELAIGIKRELWETPDERAKIDGVRARMAAAEPHAKTG